MKTLFYLAYLAMLLVFPSCESEASDTVPHEATAIAHAWLSLVDGGLYGKCWDEASPVLQERMDRETWSRALANGASELGPLEGRTLLDGRLESSPPDAPEGVYAILLFEAAHATITVREGLALRQEGDTWRVAGYWLQ